jgi:hypothetical protein
MLTLRFIILRVTTLKPIQAASYVSPFSRDSRSILYWIKIGSIAEEEYKLVW